MHRSLEEDLEYDPEIASRMDQRPSSPDDEEDSYYTQNDGYNWSKSKDHELSKSKDYELSRHKDHDLSKSEDRNSSRRKDYELFSNEDYNLSRHQDYELSQNEDYNFSRHRNYESSQSEDYNWPRSKGYGLRRSDDYNLSRSKDYGFSQDDDYNFSGANYNESRHDNHRMSRSNIYNVLQEDSYNMSENSNYVPQDDYYGSPQSDNYDMQSIHEDEYLDEKMYAIEDIVGQRIGENGSLEYLVKWENYDSSENTWEPVENLDCEFLIEAYTKRREQERYPENENNPNPLKGTQSTILTSNQMRNRMFIPERIMGLTVVTGKRLFLIKWMNADHADFVPSDIANIYCPQLVIQFYEERLSWIRPRSGRPL